jgi:hypothetical protein
MAKEPVMRLLAIVLLLTGCPDNGVSPREGCERGVEAECDRLYACFTSAELAAARWPASQAACITKLEQDRGCAAATLDTACKGNGVYHADTAAECVDQIGGLACSQLRDPNLDLTLDAPACSQVCRVE